MAKMVNISHAGRDENVRKEALLALEATATELQEALNLHTLPEVPDFCKLEPSLRASKRLITYSHRLSYTTFAAQSSCHQQLFRPPAPQEWDFRASILHRLTDAPSQKALGKDSIAQGDAEKRNAEANGAEKMQKEDTKNSPEAPKAPVAGPAPKPAFQFNNSALDFMLNEDMEEVEEEFSSSEEESE